MRVMPQNENPKDMRDAIQAFQDAMRDRMQRGRGRFEFRGGDFHRAANRAWLGVYMEGEHPNGGVIVQRVVDGSPAEKAGMRAGDVVTHVNADPVTSPMDLSSAVRRRKVDETIMIKIKRGGGEKTLPVTLAANPNPFPGPQVQVFGDMQAPGEIHIEQHDGPGGAWRMVRTEKSRSVASVSLSKDRLSVTVKLEGKPLTLSTSQARKWNLSDAQADRLRDTLRPHAQKQKDLLKVIAERSAGRRKGGSERSAG